MIKPLVFREAMEEDLDALIAIETECFATDRLSRRRMRHWIKAQNRILLVAQDERGLLGYALVLLHRGTRLARLYSIAITARARGTGLGRKLMKKIEAAASEKGRLFMRLEVAKDNSAAINLYEKLGYQVFDTFEDYYENHQDALRMQKRIRYIPANALSRQVPWYEQSTDFTCGPAALMMAMGSLDNTIRLNRELELDIWREATTIFMTSGHGGSHPIGLALAAKARGFGAEVSINKDTPAFVAGVRNPEKKAVIALVDRQFRDKARSAGVKIRKQEVSQDLIARWMQAGAAVLVLISTYQLDGKKNPHWVVVTGMDDVCLYVHDPGPPEENQTPLDLRHVPVARADFAKMSTFGSERLRTAVVIWPRN
ncbi:MAG: hypothetical protein RLZZ385_1228 [Pseudomonadota bacterium]|jgi:ribosomal protein S18 acetylase RimI-like enzyme